MQLDPSRSLDTDSPLQQAGMRLQRCEFYNWGTFHGRAWGLDLHGRNTLLTGDIGSGKSTLVDAITTLLVPSQKVSYNKAAGADAKERDLRSYVYGYYKSERGEAGSSARPVSLRDHNSYSVILGRFRNEGFTQDVTLAQVFWTKELQGQPARFFVVADEPLSVVEHFAKFGSDFNALRKRLRAMPNVEIYDTFPAYGAAFRRRFGIENEQALDLFHQTVSMKSVGNLTDFVRLHMLEAFPVESRIDALMSHFENLNYAHEAVLIAKAQIEKLEPLVRDCDSYVELFDEIEGMRACRSSLRAFFASLKVELLERRLAGLQTESSRIAELEASLQDTQRDQRRQRDDINRAVAENGGDRIEALKNEIATKQRMKDERFGRALKYSSLAREAGIPNATDSQAFLANQTAISTEQEAIEGRRTELQNLHTEKSVAFSGLKRQHNEIDTEIQSLRKRKSNIPGRMLSIRDGLCRALNLEESNLPFIGELVEVRSDQKGWEGAAERLLHNYAISVLVPDEHYLSVAGWVEKTHLGERLVYYRVRERRLSSGVGLHPDSLVRKLSIRPDSAFYSWVEADLAQRFDFACCETLDTFRRETRAITRSGQTKSGGERHEKDDRYRIDDRTRYVLGWSNEAKIAAFERECLALQVRLQAIATELAKLQNESKILETRHGKLQQLSVFENFRDLDWKPAALEIEALLAEKQKLEDGSDVLRTLQEQLATLETATTKTEGQLTSAVGERSVIEHRIEDAKKLLADSTDQAGAIGEESKAQHFPLLREMVAERDRRLTVESCDSREREVRDRLQAEIEKKSSRLNALRDKIVEAMRGYKDKYPSQTSEVDVSLESAADYRTMLTELVDDDLPRFEARFKELLNENTIREIANFQSQLNLERQSIRERIDKINYSLREIDYNPNRFIVLEPGQSTDPEIRDFQQDLRACTEGSLTGSDETEYSEAKFLQVKRIIERFRGREGTTDLDKRWTRKVSDVRNWFVFSASERWREDEREHEHYTDSGGKSGGQKEKLAYTVLAASLAYQFGLEWGETRSRSFRFVLIDEAFGRGSDESTRYGLELFERLSLQLLVVTPLQKIHVIEPFVKSVGFVHNEDGSRSMLRNLTIEEYRAERLRRAG
ncbi:ATP-dependent exonuclease SbcCD, C subunit-like protein [Bradyrhizobium sp. Arg68]|nr:ATP-dependent exonuclease SbcCD, C subunit-like protein [Bradyrhizobium ivorense]